MNPPPRTLSSAQTFFMKIVFPILWIGGFGIGTAAVFLLPHSASGSDGGPSDASDKWFFAVAQIVGTVFLWWLCVPLKRVRIDDKALYISNYSREIIVPLANVADVSENRWINIDPVTIQFHSETEFGSHITFMPRIRWFGAWSSHPVVDEIQQAVNRATGKDRA
jgi:hypothetical protein